jgi:prevent-host-death family protein
MSKTMPISEVKTRLPELVSGVEEREEEIVVTRNGRPAAVLVNYNEYERLKDTLDVLSDPVLMKQIAQSKSFYARGQQGESFQAVFGEPLVARKRRKK